MRRILVFEYLHAHPGLYGEASESMRREGRAMLLAVVDDLATIDDVQVNVAVCDAAATDLSFPTGVTVIRSNASTEIAFVDNVLAQETFDDVLPIAPETDGLLSTLAEEFRRRNQSVVAAPTKTIAIGSSKWLTFSMLRINALATIPTARLDAVQRLGLNADDMCVVKPADGAGGEGIVRCRLSEIDELFASEQQASLRIVQPLLDGDSYSVGIMGSTILPVASQHIEWIDGRPHYLGGTVSPPLPDTALRELNELLRQLLTLIEVERGYVGIDLLRTTATAQPRWLINEINPRFCTSYLGYRQATPVNLAMLLLGNQAQETIHWQPTPTPFTCAPVE
ncbi:MAG: ATP-grasp domain-containing protein [Planctomycetaceae bacterium]